MAGLSGEAGLEIGSNTASELDGTPVAGRPDVAPLVGCSEVGVDPEREDEDSLAPGAPGAPAAPGAPGEELSVEACDSDAADVDAAEADAEASDADGDDPDAAEVPREAASELEAANEPPDDELSCEDADVAPDAEDVSPDAAPEADAADADAAPDVPDDDPASELPPDGELAPEEGASLDGAVEAG